MTVVSDADVPAVTVSEVFSVFSVCAVETTVFLVLSVISSSFAAVLYVFEDISALVSETEELSSETLSGTVVTAVAAVTLVSFVLFPVSETRSENTGGVSVVIAFRLSVAAGCSMPLS